MQCLLREEVTEEISRSMERRILIAQGLYALGAALCLFDTYLSIGFIVLVQLNYVISPGFRALRRRGG